MITEITALRSQAKHLRAVRVWREGELTAYPLQRLLAGLEQVRRVGEQMVASVSRSWALIITQPSWTRKSLCARKGSRW